jgi:hypothetical protein
MLITSGIKGIPLGIYLTFSYHLGLTGLWIGLSAVSLFVSVAVWTAMLRLDWVVEVREAKERVGSEQLHGEQVHAWHMHDCDFMGGLVSRIGGR